MKPDPSLSEPDGPSFIQRNLRPSHGKIAISAALIALGAIMIYIERDEFFDFRNRYALGFDSLGIIAFGLSGFCLVVLWYCSWKQRAAAVLVSFTLYVGSYAILSYNGDYDFSQSGRVRYPFGLSMTDRVVWHPKFLSWERYTDIRGQRATRATVLGRFYAPLIAIDRQWFQPTKDLFADGDEE